ncbi:uncharacterized protein LOC105685742 [Athalia rosae]|uniref:uncharacterized protein LOC105685742 n=1 Tax=Athalia rosae TaxID=37344 RepID=UPI0020342598|nr:uncharacterized protein LOC105685742 [Athalia rosae]
MATLNFKTEVVIAGAHAGDTIFYEEAIKALSQYFTPAIISRPYRPGLYTMLDEEHEPLLIFLCKYWVELENHDIQELGRRNCGISHRHSISTRRSNPRYEFAAGTVDNAVDVDLRTFCIKGHYLATANAEDIDRLLSVNIEPENPRRKSDLRGSLTENLQIPNIVDAPIEIRTPEGVYLVSFLKQEKTTEKLQDDSKILKTCDADKSSDDPSKNELPHNYHRPKPERINGSQECSPNLRKVERERVLSRRVNDDQLKVIVKVEGTQTFECDFSEDYHRSLASRDKVTSLRESNGPREQKVDVNCIRKSVVTEKSSKTEEKCAKIPLTKSTASMLKNHLALRKDIVCFPRAAMIKLDELVPSTKNPEGLKKESIENSSISTSSANEVQKTSKNSFKVAVSRNDFVSELKEMFIQGRRRPSDHVKIVSSHVAVSEHDVKNESSFNTSGRHTAPRLSSENFGFLADGQTVALKSNSKEDVPEKNCVISLSANSI